ncbi:MAG TPA: type II toxin-antitoxin system HicB family antitoxin [Conexibacter sp.]|nr:type II toxin-antitoxin system HicB family antitoxin [Conexibacter sp.]
MATSQDIRVKIHLEDGSMWATVDDMPGVFATGDTLDELRESLQEGVALYLAQPGEEPPPVDIVSLDTVETSTQAAFTLT